MTCKRRLEQITRITQIMQIMQITPIIYTILHDDRIPT